MLEEHINDCAIKITVAQSISLVKIIFLLVALGLAGCSFSAQAKPDHWEWYPTLNLKAEIELDKEMMTFRMTNISSSDQTVLDGLFNVEFLKENLNIQLGGYNPMHGQTPPTFKLSGDGLLGNDNTFLSIKPKVIHPSQTVEVTFDIIQAMRQVHNDRLAEELKKETICYNVIFPIPLVITDMHKTGTVQFITPFVFYKLH